MRGPTPVVGRRVCEGFPADERSGRRTTVGPRAPSANLVIHRPCGRRPGCCGELRKTCARRGGQACEQALPPSGKLLLTCTFPVHRLCRRKTSPVRPRSLRTARERVHGEPRGKGHKSFASLTCGRLD